MKLIAQRARMYARADSLIELLENAQKGDVFDMLVLDESHREPVVTLHRGLVFSEWMNVCDHPGCDNPAHEPVPLFTGGEPSAPVGSVSLVWLMRHRQEKKKR